MRTEVTDSAATEFVNELTRISRQDITTEELEKAKQIVTGRFARSLEDPQTVARFAINTARYNLPKDFYEKYLQRIDGTHPSAGKPGRSEVYSSRSTLFGGGRQRIGAR